MSALVRTAQTMETNVRTRCSALPTPSKSPRYDGCNLLFINVDLLVCFTDLRFMGLQSFLVTPTPTYFREAFLVRLN